MKRESLLNLKTCREVRTSLDLARDKRPAPTMFDRMRRIVARGTEAFISHPNEAMLALAMEKERRRFKCRMDKIERAAGKFLGSRQKMAATQERNKRMMNLRLQLQRDYWRQTSPFDPPGAPPAENGREKKGPKSAMRRLRYGGRR